MTPYPHTISSPLMSEGEHPRFTIPRYQRPYTWGAADCEKLFDDIDDNNNGYFIGSVICIKNDSPDGTAHDFEVVDGQQRLTSISLLLLAICTKFQEYEDSFSENHSHDIFNLKSRLVTKGQALRLTLQTQGHNLDDYTTLLTENGFRGKITAPSNLSNVGNRRLKKNYLVFCKKIEKALSDLTCMTSRDCLKLLDSLLGKVYAAEIILIVADDDAEAYKLFESLNNTGVPLTSMDLLKNRLLSNASKESSNTADDYYSKWANIIESLTDDYATQERFLRHYYNAFRASLNRPFATEKSPFPLGAMAKKSNLLTIYPKLIEKNTKSLINDLEEKSKHYSLIISNSDVSHNCSTSLKEAYRTLNNLGAVPSHVLLLYLESNREKLKLNDSDLLSRAKWRT